MSEDKRSRYSRVFRRIWVDAKFMALSSAPPNGQTLFQRLLTGPELTNIPGVFSVGEAGLAEALGWPIEGFRKAFGEVLRQGLAKADWKARLVFVPKAIRHNKPESPNVVRSWKMAWDELPECSLKLEAYRAIRSFVEGMGAPFAEAFAEACPQPSPNQEQEQEQEQRGRGTQDAPAIAGAPPPKSEPVPSSKSGDIAEPKPKSQRGTRLDPGWRPTEDAIARLRSKHHVDPLGSLERFRNHFVAKPGRNAVKLDWGRTFDNWVDEDVSRGRLAKLDPADDLPLLRDPERDKYIPKPSEAPDCIGFSFGATSE